jgi:hypothetical protein
LVGLQFRFAVNGLPPWPDHGPLALMAFYRFCRFLMLPGVKVQDLKKNVDERGFFAEAIRRQSLGTPLIAWYVTSVS